MPSHIETMADIPIHSFRMKQSVIEAQLPSFRDMNVTADALNDKEGEVPSENDDEPPSSHRKSLN